MLPFPRRPCRAEARPGMGCPKMRRRQASRLARIAQAPPCCPFADAPRSISPHVQIPVPCSPPPPVGHGSGVFGHCFPGRRGNVFVPHHAGRFVSPAAASEISVGNRAPIKRPVTMHRSEAYPRSRSSLAHSRHSPQFMSVHLRRLCRRISLFLCIARSNRPASVPSPQRGVPPESARQTVSVCRPFPHSLLP